MDGLRACEQGIAKDLSAAYTAMNGSGGDVPGQGIKVLTKNVK
ncbi:hypothetical protein [Treponema sp. OMZ 305]|nr:hypothetical protein [Treponema sp. OMZ 305]